MLEKNLEKLGFSPSEIKIYLYLLSREPSYPNKISANTNLNRTNVYEALDRLVSKGVVSYIIRNKVKWYEAQSIESLKTLVDEKQLNLEKTKKSLLKEINKLKKKLPKEKEYLETSIFVGRKGLKNIFEEIIEVKKPVCILAAELQLSKFFGAYFEQWHKKRIEKGISQRSIFSKRLRKLAPRRKLLKLKFVNDDYINPSTTILYGNTTLLIHWSKEPLAIKIPNKEITKSHLNYFNLIWNSN